MSGIRSSCVNHPKDEPLVMFRKWQLEACDGNHCAAILLNVFEQWHRSKMENRRQSNAYNEVAFRDGDDQRLYAGLWQWHTSAELKEYILGIFKDGAIREAIDLLEKKGFIKVGSNPNPRYKFDKTKWFLFMADSVNAYLSIKCAGMPGFEVAGPATSEENAAASKENADSYISKNTVQRILPKNTPKEQEKSTVATQPALLTQCSTPKGLLEAAQGTLLPEAPTPLKKQKKEQQPIPLPDMLRTPETQKAWDMWVEHRKEIRHPLKESSARICFKLLEEIGAAEWVKAIEHSIMNDYRGLFRSKEFPRTGGAPPYVKPKVTMRDREIANGQIPETITGKVTLGSAAAAAQKKRIEEREARRAAMLAKQQETQQQNPTTEQPNQ